MPHKHTRRKDGDVSHFDLAPTSIAKPLPARTKDAKTNKKRKRSDAIKSTDRSTDGSNYKYDDTPRAFQRMMHLQTTTKPRRSGLDNGEGPPKASKKRKTGSTESPASQPEPVAAPAHKELPKIQPGERLRDYAARVDQAIPISGLTRKGKVAVDGVKERQTRTEKRLHKMYAAWREEDARRKEKLEEQQEQEEEAEEERNAAMGSAALQFPTKGKRRKMVGEVAEDEEDPWALLKERRARPKGLHDIVQAPPSFKVVPREKFKVRNGAKVAVADVPSTAGSLKRREELGEARREVIDRYRAIMGKKK